MRNFIVYDKSGKYSTAWAYDILQDKKGRIWMGSYQGGVFVMDKAALLSGKTIADWHLTRERMRLWSACRSDGDGWKG